MLAARYPSVREKPESLSSRDSATPECLAALFPLWLCFFFLQVSSSSGNSFTWAESATHCWKSVSRKTASVFSKSFSKWIFYSIKYKTTTSSFGCSFQVSPQRLICLLFHPRILFCYTNPLHVLRHYIHELSPRSSSFLCPIYQLSLLCAYPNHFSFASNVVSKLLNLNSHSKPYMIPAWRSSFSPLLLSFCPKSPCHSSLQHSTLPPCVY